MNIYSQIIEKKANGEKLFTLLVDPDRINPENLPKMVKQADQSGVDIFFIGSTFLLSNHFDHFIQIIKENTAKPVVIFPGNPNQVSQYADAILFLSVISGRNPEHLIGHHVIAAPLVFQLNMEVISTGYMLVESGNLTSAQYMNQSYPIPREKNGLAVSTALAGQYLGMKLIYLEAGSGADAPVPDSMIQKVSSVLHVPLIAGGGIKTPEEARKKAMAGADMIVIGNHFEQAHAVSHIEEFAKAIHGENLK